MKAGWLALWVLAGCTVEMEGPDETADTASAAVSSAYVFRTDGLGLNVREAPSTTSAVVGWVAEGARVDIGCQTTGSWVSGTNLWDYVTSRGGYVSDAFVYTGYDGRAPGIGECGSSGGGGDAIYVRGTALTSTQAEWVRHVAREVVPAMRGSRDRRLEKAAYVTWWALKEGILGLDGALAYSSCTFPPDRRIGPLEVCPDPNNAWQVGLSGVQAAWRSLSDVEALAASVHPDASMREILAGAAEDAGYAPGTSVGDGVASSSGRLRLSWLLRDAAVGFEAQYPTVWNECFVECSSGWERTCGWCFGSGWDTTAAFAPSQSAAWSAVADIRAALDGLAP